LDLARDLHFARTGNGVLRISIASAGELTTLQLEGQVSGKWVEWLYLTCETYLQNGASLILDLSKVSFSDRGGIALLKSMANRNVRIVNALPFIAEQIR